MEYQRAGWKGVKKIKSHSPSWNFSFLQSEKEQIDTMMVAYPQNEEEGHTSFPGSLLFLLSSLSLLL